MNAADHGVRQRSPTPRGPFQILFWFSMIQAPSGVTVQYPAMSAAVRAVSAGLRRRLIDHREAEEAPLLHGDINDTPPDPRCRRRAAGGVLDR